MAATVALQKLCLILVLSPLLLGWFGLYLLLLVPRLLLRSVTRRCALPDRVGAREASGMPVALAAVEIPLSLSSYLLYVVYRAFLLSIRDGTLAREPCFGWTDSLYASLVAPGERKFGAVSAAIAFGPRWNTHTNVHTLRVEMPASGEAVFEVENLRQSGFSWQIVVYDERQTTLATLSVAQQGPEWLQLHVHARRVAHLLIRPYVFGDRTSVVLPRVRLNGEDVAGCVQFSRERLHFNHQLREYEYAHFWALQWHVYPLLCCSSWLPPKLVRRVYLPVGNPETQWLYGPVHEGYALCFVVDERVLSEHLVFCTVYDRASFPVQPCISIEASTRTLEVCEADGFWATRVVRKDGGTTDPSVLEHISVTLCRSAKSEGQWQPLGESL
eukprot:scaffold134_cov29-Tisochrysis_lutea.AAC.2